MKLPRLIPTGDLWPLLEQPPDPVLWASLDERGMVDPLVVYEATAEHYNARNRCIDGFRRTLPGGVSVYAIKRGNQRVKWAIARNVRRLPCVTAECEGSTAAVNLASYDAHGCIMRTDALTPLVTYRDDWPTREALWTDLDARGMLHPLIAYRRDGQTVVKVGCQRLAWAVDRGVRFVPVFVCDGRVVGNVAHAAGCTKGPQDGVPPGDMRVKGYRPAVPARPGASLENRILNYLQDHDGADEDEIARDVVEPWFRGDVEPWAKRSGVLKTTPSWLIARQHARNLIRMGLVEAVL